MRRGPKSRSEKEKRGEDTSLGGQGLEVDVKCPRQKPGYTPSEFSAFKRKASGG